MEAQKKYRGKILLFGEYSLIHGSDALAIPTDLFSGFWDFNQDAKEEQVVLHDFHTYLSGLDFEKVVYQQEAFKKDLDRSLFFNSNIPIGYGAGSSGAVCAAILDQYFQKDPSLEPIELKNILAQLECFFHGSSSGLDPLISYLDQAIMIQNGQSHFLKAIQTKAPSRLFLLDTGSPRKTEPLVQLYLKKYQSDDLFRTAILTKLSGLNNLAVQQYLGNKQAMLFDTFHEISAFQSQYFQEMIPKHIRNIWEEGLSSSLFKIKLCGAGGGGFLLGITKDWQATNTAFGQQAISLF